MSEDDSIKQALALIFAGIEMLQRLAANSRKFTIDGRLVGDIGEIIAAREFEITLDQIQRAGHDAKTLAGQDVQIKATFGDSLTFTTEPALYLGLKLFRDGGHEVIFNGPGHYIRSEYAHRKGFGEKQLSFPVFRLNKISNQIPENEKVRRRTPAGWPA
jgi:hypothetical protein